MYKHAAKVAQRIWDKTGTRIDRLTPRRKSLKRLKAEAAPANAILKTNRPIGCPACGTRLQRSVRAVQQHFLQVHARRITEAEAYRFASPQRKERRAPYAEGPRKDPREVSGGLPSLGKRR